MRVRVLGCSGAIARDCRTTSFLVDDDLLIDAGTGVGDLTRDEMRRVADVFLTHAHLDHIACLPLMVDTIASARAGQPLRVHALPATIAALRQHIFNNLIWPDFTRLPSAAAPLLSFHAIEVGTRHQLQGRTLEVLPAEHAVPACGYALRGPQAKAPWWVFSGDTERNPAFWHRVNQLHVAALVIETALATASANSPTWPNTSRPPCWPRNSIASTRRAATRSTSPTPSRPKPKPSCARSPSSTRWSRPSVKWRTTSAG